MSIKYLEGNILEATTQVVVNTVNCEGFMGKGLALQFKKNFPDMFNDYKLKCKEGQIGIGRLHLYKNSLRYWILNFPTKDQWRQKSKLEYIEKGLMEFKNKYKEWGITSIAFPRLGCQQGGLDWSDVKLVMEKNLSDLPGLQVEIFSYKPTINRSTKKTRQRKKLLLNRKQNQNQRTLTRYNNKSQN
jgi:O-acetyl-ADP-ribose deacetylase (regulator of RNase III)